MPEMKNNFQGGKMNKDLDERLVPNNEYKDALNVEIVTSNDSDIGSMQTLKGNKLLSAIDPKGTGKFTCIGSITDNKNDKLYFMLAGIKRDLIVEYDYNDKIFLPVCVDNHNGSIQRTLNFNSNFLITGVNVIDDLLFWTDNNSEPKRINIALGKLGSSDFETHTNLMVRDKSPSAQPNSFIPALDENSQNKIILEKHLTVIRKGPSTAPVLEMIDTIKGDIDGDGEIGGDELTRSILYIDSILNSDGEILTSGNIKIQLSVDPDGDTSTLAHTDFEAGDFIRLLIAV